MVPLYRTALKTIPASRRKSSTHICGARIRQSRKNACQSPAGVSHRRPQVGGAPSHGNAAPRRGTTTGEQGHLDLPGLSGTHSAAPEEVDGKRWGGGLGRGEGFRLGEARGGLPSKAHWVCASWHFRTHVPVCAPLEFGAINRLHCLARKSESGSWGGSRPSAHKCCFCPCHAPPTPAVGEAVDTLCNGGWGGGRESLEGGGPPSPPQHSGPDSTPKAFPYPHTSPNRISNRQ